MLRLIYDKSGIDIKGLVGAIVSAIVQRPCDFIIHCNKNDVFTFYLSK